MTTTEYSIGENMHGYHIFINETPIKVWVENYDQGQGVTWRTTIDSVRALEEYLGMIPKKQMSSCTQEMAK